MVDEENLQMTELIVTKNLLLGGPIGIALKIAVKDNTLVAHAKMLNHLCVVVKRMKNKIKEGMLLNIFHFLAMQPHPSNEDKKAFDLLLGPDSLVKNFGLNQVSSEGLTPIEYALLNQNTIFLDSLLQHSPSISGKFSIRISDNLLCILANLM